MLQRPITKGSPASLAVVGLVDEALAAPARWTDILQIDQAPVVHLRVAQPVAALTCI
jgi:hypothetical protein